VSRDLISKVTDAVNEELAAWRNRPPGLPGDVRRRHRGQDQGRAVANRPVYIAVGVSLEGERDVLDLWAGSGGEGAKQLLD